MRHGPADQNLRGRCPVIEITTLEKHGGGLTKLITLAADGTIKSDGSACVMSHGRAWRTPLPGLDALAAHIGALDSKQAIALGALRSDLPDRVTITTARKLSEPNGSATPDLIARTAGEIVYKPGQTALALIDIDTKGMPTGVRDRIEGLGGFWPALVSVLPELAGAGRVTRPSTSTGIHNRETGERYPGSQGLHIYIAVTDGEDVERFLKTLHVRCWLAGLGWYMLGRTGQLLERSLIDRTVCAPERLVFEGAPRTGYQLAQDQTARKPVVTEGEPLDTRAVCLDLTLAEAARSREALGQDRRRVRPEAEKVQSRFTETQAERTAERTGMTLAAALKVAQRWCGGILRPGVELLFDHPGFDGATVGDVLADPDRFVGATLADPQEGIDYGRCKAKIMLRNDGTLWIHSFAHGRTTYELKYDAAAIEAVVKKCDPAVAVETFIRMLLAADVSTIEERHLRDLAAKIGETTVRPVQEWIKAAREEQAGERASEKRDRRAAERTDKRLRVSAPAPDGERMPVLRLLDEVLGTLAEPEPPMRDIGGHPVEILCRAPLNLHELSSHGANRTGTREDRLPAPAIPLLTRHSRLTLAQRVERYIEFHTSGENERSVALASVFVDHYLEYRESALPRVAAIVTAPLVLPDGSLLARQGLDRDRKLVFRIEPGLLERLPAGNKQTRHDAAAALRYLTQSWLCDVATDFAGKCVLIALALSILERVLLPERPAFFTTAGKRGGGKTTALSMVILAATGKKPAAAAWATSEDERRKAMLAHLMDGLPVLVWDNLPLGSTISCPTLEKVLGDVPPRVEIGKSALPALSL